MWNGQRDPTFTRDQSNLRIGNGGVGFRDTPERALFLNTMCNIAPAIAGNANRPSLWPSLRDMAFGANLLELDAENGGWTHFFATGNPYATELASEISEPLTMLYKRSLEDRTVPGEWKRAKISAIFKKGNRTAL